MFKLPIFFISIFVSRKNYEFCSDAFELACKRSNFQLGPACSNAVYCRMLIMDWGFNGTGYEQDMQRVIEMTEMETSSGLLTRTTNF